MESRPITLPFGMHKNVPVEEIPTDYLTWVLRECKLSSRLRAALAEELLSRGVQPPASRRTAPPRTCARHPGAGLRCEWQEDCRGELRIRATCRQCKRFICFAPQTEFFVRMANAHTSQDSLGVLS
jgi:hypothetical protein